MEEERGPRVPRSQGTKDQDISNIHSNMSLTLKKVHVIYHKSYWALSLTNSEPCQQNVTNANHVKYLSSVS